MKYGGGKYLFLSMHGEMQIYIPYSARHQLEIKGLGPHAWRTARAWPIITQEMMILTPSKAQYVTDSTVD